jgi:ABC-type polysaccharide/polyol phosphate export permease
MLDLARRAFLDIGAALKLKGVWMALASEDIADSHRRTLLGPAWPLLNFLLLAGTIILTLGHVTPGVNFTAYLASGLVVWLFISETLAQSATLFLREAGFIQGTVLPISIYVLRQTTLTAMRSGYALAGAVPLILFSGVEFTPALLSIPAAVLLLLVTAPAVAVLFGFAGVFFRDFQHIVGHATRLLMFITPVFWTGGGGGGLRGLLYHWNPLTHYIDIVRQPVVSGIVPLTSWAIAGTATALLCAAALLVLGKFNRRIVFLL